MMKRNILAVVIPALLVAGAANAAEIYNKNANKLDFYGKAPDRKSRTHSPGQTPDRKRK
jgi:outer membrane pore protein F